MSQRGGEKIRGGKYWGKLALGHYTMALGQFITTFTGGLVWVVFKFYSRCSADFLFIYFFFIFEMTSGMVLTIRGKVPSSQDESKEEQNMAPTGLEASEWKMKQMDQK